MSEGLHDEQALLLLLKCPKKKYIKHLIQYGIMLALNHNKIPQNLSTPITKSFKSDMQLSTEQSHRLLLSLSNLIQLSIRINFNFQKYSKYIFSQQFDEQLKTVLISTIVSLQSDIEEMIANRLRMGNKLIDFDWKLDLQIANQKGKTSVPIVWLNIESLDNQSNAELQTDKIQMKGEQFMAFFGNLKKIKESLLDLVGGKSEGNEGK